jgi:hypothetical protein
MQTNTVPAFAAALVKLVAVAGLAFSGASHAAILSASSGAAGNTVASYGAPGQVSFDLDLARLAPTRLVFTIEASDLLGPLSLNAIVRNLSGAALDDFAFRLDGIGFAQAGSVTPTFGTLDRVGHDGGYASIAFSAPEWAEFHFGNPLLDSGAADWLLDTAGLRAGDTFAITAEVPEPSTAALMLSALCMSGLLALRRRHG